MKLPVRASEGKRVYTGEVRSVSLARCLLSNDAGSIRGHPSPTRAGAGCVFLKELILLGGVRLITSPLKSARVRGCRRANLIRNFGFATMVESCYYTMDEPCSGNRANQGHPGDVGALLGSGYGFHTRPFELVPCWPRLGAGTVILAPGKVIVYTYPILLRSACPGG